MKKVLLTTTAMAFAASIASAGDMSMSGAIKLTYGAFGTGDNAGAATEDFTSEADLDIAATSAGGNISMSGTLELDESGSAAGPVTISTGMLTFTYDKNDLGALAMSPDGTVNAGIAGNDGEDNNYGDYSVAFSAGGMGVVYTKDQETSDNVIAVTYTAGALALSLTANDESNGPTDGALVYDEAASGDTDTVIGATYTTGPYTIALSGDDQATQNWDASVAMASGDTTITVAADETEMMSVGIAYAAGSMSLSARQEFNNAAGTDDETEFGITYTDGALTFGAAYDSGDNGKYGDEAELLINASYVDGDVTVAAKGTDQDEMEVSVTFSF